MIRKVLKEYERDLVISEENGKIHIACPYLLGWDVECGVSNAKSRKIMENCIRRLEELGCNRTFSHENSAGWTVDLSFPL